MDKRFQVFISSTFTDLQSERQEVLQALLELDCIPSGMELFPAADEDQWSLIKKVISDCDYYILVSAGRYGSLGPGGKSYSHMEYEYAESLRKPIIAFIHRDIGSLPSNMVESSDIGRELLLGFHEICKKKLVKFWEGPQELGSIVSRSLIQLMKSRPAVGWVRADNLPSEDTAAEMLRLRSVIDSLQNQLSIAKTSMLEDISDLVQGDDMLSIEFTFRARTKDEKRNIVTYEATENIKFRTLFSSASPHLMDEAHETSIKSALENAISSEFKDFFKNKVDASDVGEFKIKSDSFQTIKVQMVALGLIEKGVKKRQVQDRLTYWKLTERGELEMMQERAVRKTPIDFEESLG
jgi:hypothetical protein